MLARCWTAAGLSSVGATNNLGGMVGVQLTKITETRRKIPEEHVSGIIALGSDQRHGQGLEGDLEQH